MVAMRAQLTLYIRYDKPIDRPNIRGVGGVWSRVGWELKIAPKTPLGIMMGIKVDHHNYTQIKYQVLIFITMIIEKVRYHVIIYNHNSQLFF